MPFDNATELAALLKRLERRVRALEAARPGPRTAIAGGQVRWTCVNDPDEAPQILIGAGTGEDISVTLFDDTGASVIYLGMLFGGALFQIRNPATGQVTFQQFDGKQTTPLIPSAWQQDPAASLDAVGRPTTTSASYTELWRTYLPCLTGGVKTKFVAAPGAGNTMSVRIRAEAVSGGAGPVDVMSQTGITVTTDIDSQWSIPDAVMSPAADPIGSTVILTLEALRSAGATAVAVAPYLPVLNWDI